MSPRLTLCCLALLASCSRDLTIPPAPPVLPGAIFGRVVIAVPGRAEKQPAKGAQVALLGSSLSVTAGEDGRFALTEVNQSVGKLLFRYVEGTHVRQKLVSLEAIGAGKNRQVSLGDVLVAENATVVGKALRAELAESRMGHRGTVVFVPEGPFLTYTADDGSFELADLPEGAIEVGFFRSGYQSIVLPALSLRGGELLTLRDVVLAAEPDPAPGAILGSVKFAPPLDDASGAIAVASGDGVTRQASAVANGDFQLEDLPAGLYAVQLSRPSYSPTTVFNVLVVSGQSTRISDVVLGQGASFDAGQPPGPPDASVDPGDAGSDGGSDGGTDGGTDAGIDAGPSGCTQQLDCGSGQWCDDGFCVPQCTPGSCSNGRVCEMGTRTCVTPCDGGCAGGTTCDLNINACAPLCGGPVTCGAGFVCNATTSLCESECSSSRPCPNHYSCNAGQCVSLGTCDLDTDCPRTKVCLNGTCAARSPDGGASCTTACGCRLDETCQYDAGQCVVIAPPTLFFVPDAGGDGLTTSTPSGSLPTLASLAQRGDVIAMLAGTTASFTGPITLDGGVTLSGGYVDCGPNRWVRDDTLRSSLEGGPTAIRITGTAVHPREDISLRNLRVTSINIDTIATISASQVSRFTAENLEARLSPAMPANGFAFLYCSNCTDVRFRSIGLPASPDVATPMSLVELHNSSGQVDQVWIEDQAQKNVFGVLAVTLSGPLSVTNSRFGALSAETINGLIRVDDCSAYSLTVTGNQMRWSNISTTQFEGRSMVLTNCNQLTVTNNLVDGRAQSARLRASEAHSAAFSIYNSKGTFANNTVFFPAGLGGGAVAFDLRGPELDLDFHHNVSDGGVSLAFATALRIKGVSLGAVDVHDNQLGAHGAGDVRGLDMERIAAAAGLNFRDNEVFVDAPATLGAKGIVLTDGVNGQFERNVVVVGPSGVTHGLLVLNGGANVNVEFLQNLFRVGAGVAPGQFSVGSFGWEINSAGQYTFVGNSLDMNPDPTQPGPSMAVQCSSAAVMTATSNIIGAGNKQNGTSILGSTGGTCYAGSTFQKNYAWHTASALVAMDQTGVQFTADAGTFDSNGNVIAPGVSPYAAPGSFELGSSSLCIDRGLAGVRSDSSPITLDALRRPRVVGSSADIGGTEKQ